MLIFLIYKNTFWDWFCCNNIIGFSCNQNAHIGNEDKMQWYLFPFTTRLSTNRHFKTPFPNKSILVYTRIGSTFNNSTHIPLKWSNNGSSTPDIQCAKTAKWVKVRSANWWKCSCLHSAVRQFLKNVLGIWWKQCQWWYQHRHRFSLDRLMTRRKVTQNRDFGQCLQRSRNQFLNQTAWSKWTYDKI